MPGFQSFYNGGYANLWVVGHEAGECVCSRVNTKLMKHIADSDTSLGSPNHPTALNFLLPVLLLSSAGHNWGLLHGWISDPLNIADEEYGDNTEIMASARDTWEGLSYMVRGWAGGALIMVTY